MPHFDDVTDDVSDYVIDFDVSDDVIDFDVDVANFDLSDAADFDVISTDELTTILPFDNVTFNVAFSSFPVESQCCFRIFANF